MWFRNLIFCRFTASGLDADSLAQSLSRQVFQPCGKLDMASHGWVPPAPHDERLVHALGGQWLIALATEQRLLPAAVINQHAQARAAELEAKQGYKPGRKMLRELRDRVADELMPRAFTQQRTTRAWIDPAQGWFGVDAGSLAKADELLECLRKCLDDVPLKSLRPRVSPLTAMSAWLAEGDAPAGFSIDRDCELRAASDEKSIVRYTHHALDAKDVRDHLAAGKQATRLALTWKDRISFVLHEDLMLKRLSFLDLLKEQTEAQSDNADEQFDADFALMAGELGRFLADLVDALGGELPPA